MVVSLLAHIALEKPPSVQQDGGFYVMDMINIEVGFQEMVKRHEARSKPNKATGIETVLQFLLDHPGQIWWWSWELIGKVNSVGGYLSHRALARASDLAIHFPLLVEDRKIGRFAVYRIRIENMEAIKEFLKIQ